MCTCTDALSLHVCTFLSLSLCFSFSLSPASLGPSPRERRSQSFSRVCTPLQTKCKRCTPRESRVTSGREKIVGIKSGTVEAPGEAERDTAAICRVIMQNCAFDISLGTTDVFAFFFYVLCVNRKLWFLSRRLSDIDQITKFARSSLSFPFIDFRHN